MYNPVIYPVSVHHYYSVLCGDPAIEEIEWGLSKFYMWKFEQKLYKYL